MGMEDIIKELKKRKRKWYSTGEIRDMQGYGGSGILKQLKTDVKFFNTIECRYATFHQGKRKRFEWRLKDGNR
jgi:hypothetical protein